MGFSGLLELYKMYGIHLQPILKLTSALIGDVMEVAENSKFLDFLGFLGYNFLNLQDFFTVFRKRMYLNRYNRNIKEKSLR